jgi:voltage-gated potassium channel
MAKRPRPANGRLLGRMLGRKPLTPRRAVVIIAVYTLLATIAGGVLARLTDPKDFHSLGDGMWFAIQTITTVGYGDVVPHAGEGRAIGAFVMLSGIGFLTVVTASVTAAFVEYNRARLVASRPETSGEEVARRLAAIEARLDELGPRES